MADYDHGIGVREQETSLAVPMTGTAGLQVIFGTAPVNQALEPYKAANVPKLVYSFPEAVEAVGYCDDFKNYTLCSSIYANFKAFQIAPIILVNVLDPSNPEHVKDVEEKEYEIKSMQATIEEKGLLLDKVKVKNGSADLKRDKDYVLTFDDSGYVILTLMDESIKTVTVSGTAVNPEGVDYMDIIGGYDAVTGTEKGLELVRQIYPRFGMTPGLLIAPGWSKNISVAAVMNAKCTEINGVFSCECVVDLDSSGNGLEKYNECKTYKEKAGITGKHQIALWPEVTVGEYQMPYSAIYAAAVAYYDAENGDVPNLSPSNILAGVTGTVLEDGTEVILDELQANFMNKNGIVTAINDLGYKIWGNNTACYPTNTDPKDRWICCRRFFSWWGNSFILSYKNKVDSPMNHVLIESICDTENIRGNSLKDQGKCAGARISYNASENTIADILNGRIRFHQKLAPYTPAEYIENVLEFDPELLQAALSGGEA